MALVVAIDPGTEQSALVQFDGERVLQHLTLPNVTLLDQLRSYDWTAAVLVLEMIASYGMAVGKETFETVFWIGRFAEAWHPARFDRMYRRDVKQHLCHTARATDSNIRQALIDRFGPTSEKAIGRKANPGPLYGLKGHEFAALAVAITWWDQYGLLPEPIRPGLSPEF